MFDHVTIRVSDRDASEAFYNTVLAPLGIDQTYQLRTFSEWQDFSLAAADAAQPATRRLHVGFVAPSREQVAAFWRAGIDAGYTDAGAPGPRPEYLPDYYGAFLLDPDGNSIEAVHHGDLRRGGVVDHLFHKAATAAGFRSNGAPGERPQYHRGYYAAYVLDPDGNNVELVNHHR